MSNSTDRGSAANVREEAEKLLAEIDAHREQNERRAAEGRYGDKTTLALGAKRVEPILRWVIEHA